MIRHVFHPIHSALKDDQTCLSSHPLYVFHPIPYIPALKGYPGEAVMACEMPEPCEFPSLKMFLKRLPWTRSEVDHAPHPVVGLVLQVGDAKKVPPALGLKSLDPFFFFFPELARREREKEACPNRNSNPRPLDF